MDTVLLTVTGDGGTIEVYADPTVPFTQLVASWAARCSRAAVDDLVAVIGDDTTIVDPSSTLSALRVGSGTAVRLLTREAALDVLAGPSLLRPLSPPAGPPPAGPLPGVAGGPLSAAPLPAPAPPGAPRTTAPPPPSGPPGLAPRPAPRAAPSVRYEQPAPPPGGPPSLGVPAPPVLPPGSLEPRLPPDGSPYPVAPPAPRPPDEQPAPLRPLAGDTPAPVPPGPGVWPERGGTPTPWPPAPPVAVPPTLRPAALGDATELPAGTRDEELSIPDRVPGRRRWARAVKAGLSRHSAPEPPPRVFAKAAAPKAGERYRLALQETDRVHNLEMLIRSAPLRRCVVIAVVSPKGGAGKTTMTALLGTLLAELRRDPVLALDANPDFGNLRDKLAGPDETVTSTDDLAEWLAARPGATPAELASLLGSGPHGLRYLPTPTGSIERMVRAANFDLYRDLIARLRDYEGIILVDCGTGLLDAPVRAALGTADQILLVTDSSADTARLVVKAARYLPTATPTWLVANKMPDKGAMVDLDQVVSAIPQLRGVTIVPEQRLSENIVTPSFDWSSAPDTWTEPVREVAARLANNWRSLR